MLQVFGIGNRLEPGIDFLDFHPLKPSLAVPDYIIREIELVDGFDL